MNNSALNLPNILTLSNLFCGCCAVLYLFHGQPETAAWFTLASFLFDYADGMVARALKITSPLGKELDSLADVISFGVAPGAMLYLLLANTTYAGNECPIVMAALPAFILSAFSGLRLAKFNLDTRQTTYFLGLSTPACTVFMLGITLGAYHDTFGFGTFLLANKWLIYLLIPIFSAMLISEIPMFGLKLKSLNWKDNAPLLFLLALLIPAVFFLKMLALPLIVIAYILLSLVFKEKVTV